jgi:hypothetical protein
MSPIEVMAKTRHDRITAGSQFTSWDSMPASYRDEMMREAAADLFALSAVLRPALW